MGESQHLRRTTTYSPSSKALQLRCPFHRLKPSLLMRNPKLQLWSSSERITLCRARLQNEHVFESLILCLLRQPTTTITAESCLEVDLRWLLRERVEFWLPSSEFEGCAWYQNIRSERCAREGLAVVAVTEGLK